MNRVRVGTRGSALAMWQARKVLQILETLHPDLQCEIVVVKTAGDIIRDVPLSSLPGKAFFTKEIEDALIAHEIDLAVHSGKDLPTELPEGLELMGFLKRQSPEDAWLSRNGARFKELPAGSKVGTSSLRRKAFIAHYRPDLIIDELRGNVDTRIKKLKDGRYDAIVLAAAGLLRLDLAGEITELMELSDFLPAVAQGAIAVETREGDTGLLELKKALVDPDTTLAVTAERALLATVEGGCQVPLGAHATIRDEKLELRAMILSPDGTIRIDGCRAESLENPEGLGKQLAAELLSRGGAAILEQIRANQPEGETDGQNA